MTDIVTLQIDVDIDAERAWLNTQKAEIDTETGNPVSWQKLGKQIGVNEKTLSLFGIAKYTGRNDRVADDIRAYRESQARNAGFQASRLQEPDYVNLPTANRINSLLEIAQSGQITLACTGPGTCKTFIAKRYLNANRNIATMVTMEPSKKKLTPMVTAVFRALISDERKSTSTMSELIAAYLKDGKRLLIVDEANNLDFECLEQLRAWHDATGVGICLLGNEDLIKTIRSGNHRQALGRLNSRIDQCHVQDCPLADDVISYLAAWGIQDEGMQRILLQVGLRPGSGGLREIKKIVQAAALLASGDGVALSGKYLREAQAGRSTQMLRAVA